LKGNINVVVQMELTGLCSINLKGNINGVVENCAKTKFVVLIVTSTSQIPLLQRGSKFFGILGSMKLR